MLQWLKDHIALIAFLIGLASTGISFIVYLDTQHDKEIAREIIAPIMQDVHDEVVQNRQEVLRNRQENEKTAEKIDELERQTISTHTKLDLLLDMMKKEFKQ